MQTMGDLNNRGTLAARPASAVDWRGVGLYVLLAFAISWALFSLKVVGVPFLVRASAGMFGPAIACILVRLLRHEGFADAGLRLQGREVAGTRDTWRLYILAYVAPLLLLALGYGLGVLFQAQQWGFGLHYEEFARLLTTQTRGVPLNIPLLFAAQILFAMSAGVALTMTATFGEELGWRGYLLPRLAPLGAVRAALLVGVIWGFWHAPVIVLDGYEFNGLYPALGVFFFLLFTVPTSVVFAWLRFNTGSIWPPVLAHATLNTFAGLGLGVFFTWGNPYIAAPVGLFGILPWIVFAAWLIATKRVAGRSTATVAQPPTL